MRTSTSMMIMAALLIGASPAVAANNGKKGNGSADTVHAAQTVAGVITAAERSIILGYIDSNRTNLPPSLANAQALPPGIARKVARGGSLPPGIAKRYLPNDLAIQLPPRPGYQWVVVGRDVLLIAAATSLIVDILNDVL
jgi:hypothetical protein